MADSKRKLTVTWSEQATQNLEAIWEWNASKYGVAHADEYIQFLRSETEKLGSDFYLGRQVPGRPQLRYIVIKKSASGSSHGHLAVYRVIEGEVQVLEYFHTAQAWSDLSSASED